MLSGGSLQERGTGLPQGDDRRRSWWWQGTPVPFLGDTEAAAYPVSLFGGREQRPGPAGGAGPCWPGRYRSHRTYVRTHVHTHTRTHTRKGCLGPHRLATHHLSPCGQARKDPNTQGDTGKNPRREPPPPQGEGLCSSPVVPKLKNAPVGPAPNRPHGLAAPGRPARSPSVWGASGGLKAAGNARDENPRCGGHLVFLPLAKKKKGRKKEKRKETESIVALVLGFFFLLCSSEWFFPPSFGCVFKRKYSEDTKQTLVRRRLLLTSRDGQMARLSVMPKSGRPLAAQ